MTTYKALLLIGVALSVAPAHADALLDQVRAGVKADAARTWNLARAFQSFDKNGKAERTSFAKLENGKWTLVAYAGAKPTDDVIKSFNESAAAGKVSYPKYAALDKFLAANPVPLSETATAATYKITSLPAKAFEFQNEDLSKYLVAELTIVKGPAPYVSKLRMYNAKPFRMSLAKVEKVEQVRVYGLTADGLPVAMTSEFSADASALFQSIAMRQKVALSEQRLAAAK